MDFFGGKTVEKIFDAGIENVIDLLNFNLFNKETMIASGLFKDGKTLDRLIYQVRQVKEIPLWKVICFVGVDNLGETVSKQIAKMVTDQEYSKVGLQRDFFDKFEIGEHHRDILNNFIMNLEYYGIRVITDKIEEIVEEDKTMNAYSVELTGSPKTAGWKTKDEFLAEASKHAIVHQVKKLDASTNYLITDNLDSTTSKMTTASKLGVKTVTYSEFMNIISK